MINFFPEPYPDELLYSAVARYHHQSTNKQTSLTIHQLFGKHSLQLSHELPQGIDLLLSKVPGNHHYTLWDLALNHTLFAYYASFLTNKEKRKLLLQITNHLFQHDSYLISNRHVRKQKLKCCPVCIVEDINNVGEAYWHVSHQPNSIKICIHHKQLLIDRCFGCGKSFFVDGHRMLLCDPNCQCGYNHCQFEEKISLLRNSLQTLEYITQNTIQLMSILKNPLAWIDYKSFYLRESLRYLTDDSSHCLLLESDIVKNLGESLFDFILEDIKIPTKWTNQIANFPERPIDPVFLHLLLFHFNISIHSSYAQSNQAA